MNISRLKIYTLQSPTAKHVSNLEGMIFYIYVLIYLLIIHFGNYEI